VLAVDDDADILATIEALLAPDHRFIGVHLGHEAILIIEREAPEVILTERFLGDIGGVTVLDAAEQVDPDSARIILTNEPDIPAAIAAVNRGKLFDYLTKPVDPMALLEAVRLGIQHSSMLKTRRAHVDALRHINADLERAMEERTQALVLKERTRGMALREAEELSRRDTLTGLSNRRMLDETLARELVRAQRSGSELSVVMIDLDHFKRVNDQCGHIIGDQMLTAVAAAMNSHVRPYDLLSRWGGEEFVVVLVDCGAEEAGEVCERLRTAVADVRVGGYTGRVTASFGIATWQNGEDSQTLIKRADEALFQAKREGRNRVRVSQAILIE